VWFLLALISAFLYSFRRFFEKDLSEKANPLTIGFAVQAFSLPGLAMLLFFADIPNLYSLSFQFFWLPLLIIWIFLYPLQAYFYYKSLKEGELSFVLPLMSTIPIFTILSAWILLGELPSLLGLLGIFSIVAGIYFLNMRANTKFYSPVTHLFHDRPSLFMIINCLCLAIGSTLDKVAVKASNPLFYAFINTLGASIILFVIAQITAKHFFPEIKKNFKGFSIVGTLQAFAFITYIIALTTGIVPYVLAIKSSAAIIGTIWGFILLKESLTRNKITALVLIALGLGLIAFA
jgi:drug/metabolite transporter (DMT)-like permease